MMNEDLLLGALKVDLGVSSDVFSGRLRARIRTAQERLAREGVILADTEEDRDLVIMYAGYLWRSRVDGAEMPRMLRYAINNRLLSQKASQGV